MKMLCDNLSSIYLLHIHFNLRTVAAALVVVYSTDGSSYLVAIEADQLLSVSRYCHAVGLGVLVLAWQNLDTDRT